MTELARGPQQFRRRLMAAFVLVAALSSGVLALVTYGLASSYRWRNFRESSEGEVRVALALAPRQLDKVGFDRLLAAYEKRTGTDSIAFDGGQTFSSSAVLSASDLPKEIRDATDRQLQSRDVLINGREYLVVFGPGPGTSRYAFLFSLEQLQASLDELRLVLIIGWAVLLLVAMAFGDLVARRTLRPVRAAADAANAMANGLLHTRLVASGTDEFAALAGSFNEMADALETKIDELARAAERERQFTADVAHDLRTPLTGMAATASLLDEQLDELPSDSRRAVTVLVRDVRRLRDLVLELLELSRLDTGSEPTVVETLDVREAISATIESLSLDGTASIELHIEPGLQVRAERPRVRRIIGNLLANAATHGGGTITVLARQDDDRAVIDVCDDGPGIPERDLGRIFNRLYKGDQSRAFGGSGLGLAIAREHARAQGGDVTVRNRDEGGSCFTLALPLGCEDEPPSTRQRLQPSKVIAVGSD